MSTSYPILPLQQETGAARIRPGAEGRQSAGRESAEHALPGGSERAVPQPRSFAQALASSQPTGWDPREVWLNRVHKPREGRRTW